MKNVAPPNFFSLKIFSFLSDLCPFSQISMTAFDDFPQFSFFPCQFSTSRHGSNTNPRIEWRWFRQREFFIGTTVDTKSISSRNAEVTNEIVKWSVSLTIIIVRGIQLPLESMNYRSGFCRVEHGWIWNIFWGYPRLQPYHLIKIDSSIHFYDVRG